MFAVGDIVNVWNCRGAPSRGTAFVVCVEDNNVCNVWHRVVFFDNDDEQVEWYEACELEAVVT